MTKIHRIKNRKTQEASHWWQTNAKKSETIKKNDGKEWTKNAIKSTRAWHEWKYWRRKDEKNVFNRWDEIRDAIAFCKRIHIYGWRDARTIQIPYKHTKLDKHTTTETMPQNWNDFFVENREKSKATTTRITYKKPAKMLNKWKCSRFWLNIKIKLR